MKFHEYITQRRAFGRTPWLRALLIWGLSGGLIVAGVWILVERDWWGLAPLLVGISVRITMGFGTKKNWKEDKAREEKGPNNPLNHHKELWDGADYVCIHGIKPSKLTHKCAWPIAHDLDKFPDEPSAQERAIQCDL